MKNLRGALCGIRHPTDRLSNFSTDKFVPKFPFRIKGAARAPGLESGFEGDSYVIRFSGKSSSGLASHPAARFTNIWSADFGGSDFAPRQSGMTRAIRGRGGGRARDGDGCGGSSATADGAREAHAVGTDDWPVIRKLKDAGQLTYADDEVRAGMDEIAKRGLDR